MRVTILGSGTVVPSADRNSAGYFVELPEGSIMLDCGAGTVHALARYGLDWERLTHLFVSHFHVDHVGELASLFFAFRWGMRSTRKEPLTLLGPKGLDRVLDGLKRAFGEHLFEPAFPVVLQMLEPGEWVDVAGGRFSVQKTPHTPESLAARLELGAASLGYTGDTDYSEDLVEFFAGVHTLISECSFEEKRAGVPHVSVDEVAAMAARARVGRLVVTHFYFDVDEAALMNRLSRGYSGPIIIGKDGLRLTMS